MILVTGASGGLGRLVLDRLADGGPVIAGSRTPDRVLREGDVRHMDFDDPTSLVSGFEGAEVLLLISAGQGEDDTVIRRHGAAIDAAEQAGVKHIVYTSLTGAGDCLALALTHRWTERRLMVGRADWTILRNGLYAELGIPGAAQAAVTGEYNAPMGDGLWAAVAREDLADVAAKVTRDVASHRGKVYELVADRAVSGVDIADTVADSSGRSVSYKPTNLAQLRQELTEANVPAWQVPTVVSTHANIAAGFLAGTDGSLKGLLDTPPAPHSPSSQPPSRNIGAGTPGRTLPTQMRQPGCWLDAGSDEVGRASMGGSAVAAAGGSALTESGPFGGLWTDHAPTSCR